MGRFRAGEEYRWFATWSLELRVNPYDTSVDSAHTHTLLLGLSVGCQAFGAAAWVFAVLGAERLVCIRWSGFQGLCVGRKGELMIFSLSPQHADSSLPLRFFCASEAYVIVIASVGLLERSAHWPVDSHDFRLRVWALISLWKSEQRLTTKPDMLSLAHCCRSLVAT